MRELPGRQGLVALTAAVQAIADVTALGFAQALEGEQVSVVYSYALGFGGFALPLASLPAALQPGGLGVVDTDDATLRAGADRATERFLLDNGSARLISVPLVGTDPASRFWVALRDASPLSGEQVARLAAAAADGQRVLQYPPSPDDVLRRLPRLEQAAELIPALLHVLDVREVIERLSHTAKRALPHDLLLLNLFSEDLSTFTVYARSDQGAGLGMVRPNMYPTSTIQAWTFSIVDDHTLHPMERESAATKIGARSSLRFPIRFDDRVVGGVSFVSFTPRAFDTEDVIVGQRLADYVASAISHFQLAERLAEEARRAEELRARTASLELLEELLQTVGASGPLEELIDRISAIAQKLLPHDATVLAMYMPDRRHVRPYVSSRFDTRSAPAVVELPERMQGDDWDFEVVDDLSVNATDGMNEAVRLGFHSALRMAVRVDGRVLAALVFLKRELRGFRQQDVAVGRRVADRVTVSLAREFGAEARRRADEASERAARLEARVRSLTEELDARSGYRRVIGESASWRAVLKQATQVAATDTTVLLLGESGTGKEVIARFIHRASPRSKAPFIALNCAALPEQLLEAELFGYERGAFTGATQSKPGQLEQAAGGTLFLDEVGEMSLSAQAKFLRVLQEREFQRLGGTRVLRSDARVVAATNRDLQKAIANNQFREDLFYRLNVFAIPLPPLRDRRDDILPLTQEFLSEFTRAFAHPPAGISREAKQMLLAYHWPGNIRELRNILERAAILCDGGLITDEHLALRVFQESPELPHRDGFEIHRRHHPAAPDRRAVPAAPGLPGSEGKSLQSVERTMIEEALQSARYNKSKAAKALGLTRHQLYIRMRRYGLTE